MKTLAAIGLLSLVAAGTTRISGDQRLSVHVSPAVSLAPAVLTVRATVEPDDNNRALDISVNSPDYSSRSEIQLEGKRAQRLSVFELKGLPPGLYEVRATLMGASGEVATSIHLVKVQPSPGHSH